MPTWLIERGFRFGIFAVDCLEAVHVHIVGNGGIAKLWLGPIRVARVHGYNRHQLGEIVRIAREHEDEFLGRWHEFCGQAD